MFTVYYPRLLREWFDHLTNQNNTPANLYHVSHNDLDGDGCLIVTAEIRKFPSSYSYKCSNISNLSTAMNSIAELAETCPQGDNIILITDIGSLDISRLEEIAAMHTTRFKSINFIIIDHHQVKYKMVEDATIQSFAISDLNINWLFDNPQNCRYSLFSKKHVEFLHCEDMCATLHYFLWFCVYASNSIESRCLGGHRCSRNSLFAYMAKHAINVANLYNFVINVDYHDRGRSYPIRYEKPDDIHDKDLCPHAEMLNTLHSAIQSNNKSLPDYARMNTEQMINILSEALLILPFRADCQIMLIKELENNKKLYEKFYDGLVKDVHMKGDKSLIISDKIPTETGTDDFIMAIQVPEELVNEQFFFAYIVDAAHDLTKYPYSDFSKNIFLMEDQEIDLIFRVNTHYNSVDIRARNTFPCAFAVASFNDGGGHPCAAGFPIKE